MNNTAKVVCFYKTEGPEVLRIEETRWPIPVGNEALIRTQAVALSRPDLIWREGSHFETPIFPARIGYDAAGVDRWTPCSGSKRCGPRFTESLTSAPPARPKGLPFSGGVPHQFNGVTVNVAENGVWIGRLLVNRVTFVPSKVAENVPVKRPTSVP
jgi:hypothetical protein